MSSALQSVSDPKEIVSKYSSSSSTGSAKKCVINDFHTTKRLPIRFLFLVISVYAFDIDAADSGADGEGAAVHVGKISGADVGIIGPPTKS